MDGLRTEVCGQQKNSQTTPATTSTAPVHQRRGSANAETTPAGAPAAAADRKQRPDAAREGKNANAMTIVVGVGGRMSIFLVVDPQVVRSHDAKSPQGECVGISDHGISFI